MTGPGGTAAEPALAPGACRHRLCARLPALAGLAQWCAAVAQAERLDPAIAQAFDLCLSELVTNVIEHAGPVPVLVDARADAAGLVVTVWDAGAPFDPLAHPAPAQPGGLETVPIGGLGLALVRQFARGLHYTRHGAWNCLRFVPQG